jgi:hypothetical protein
MANTNVYFTVQLGRWRHRDSLGFAKTDLNDTMLQNSCVGCNFSHTNYLKQICPFLYSHSHCIQNLPNSVQPLTLHTEPAQFCTVTHTAYRTCSILYSHSHCIQNLPSSVQSLTLHTEPAHFCTVTHTAYRTCPVLYNHSHCIQNPVSFHSITQAVRLLSKKNSHKN